MNKNKFTSPYKCIKDLVYDDGGTKKYFTRGLVYNSYRNGHGNTCFINNQGIAHELTDSWFFEYFANVNYQLELI